MSEYKGAQGNIGKKPARYPDDVRAKAVDMFNRSREDLGSKQKAAQHVADLLGIGHWDTIVKWARQAEIDGGVKEGLTTDDHDELRRLRRENAELKRANGILRAASAFFAAELDRPQSK
jgi:transposase